MHSININVYINAYSLVFFCVILCITLLHCQKKLSRSSILCNYTLFKERNVPISSGLSPASSPLVRQILQTHTGPLAEGGALLGHKAQPERLVLMEQWKTLQKRSSESRAERPGSPLKHSCWRKRLDIGKPKFSLEQSNETCREMNQSTKSGSVREKLTVGLLYNPVG